MALRECVVCVSGWCLTSPRLRPEFWNFVQEIFVSFAFQISKIYLKRVSSFLSKSPIWKYILSSSVLFHLLWKHVDIMCAESAAPIPQFLGWGRFLILIWFGTNIDFYLLFRWFHEYFDKTTQPFHLLQQKMTTENYFKWTTAVLDFQKECSFLGWGQFLQSFCRSTSAYKSYENFAYV